jgi:predicted MFS family arabinose efflux permease
VIAAAGPIVASLIGDLFAPAERGRIYGFILTGELLGAGFGLLISGDLAAVWSWRAPFGLLAILGLALACALRRLLSEPQRGGANRLPTPARLRASERSNEQAVQSAPDLGAEIQRAGIAPRAGRFTERLPESETMWWAVRSVLSVRTNVVLIAASSLGYFFYGGLQTFAVMFAKARFGLNQAEASVFLLVIGAGAVAGILLAGRLSDWLISQHHVNARPTVAAASYLLAVAIFLPGLLASSLLVAVPLLFLAVIGVGGANPALDAARLDVMPSRLWGRAESVRTVLRTTLQSGAPLVFGWTSTQLGGATDAGVGNPDSTQPPGALGLDRTFLIMLIPLLVAAALLAFAARRTYPTDVATALASDTLDDRPEPGCTSVAE